MLNSENNIKSKIYEIRGKQVILDSDVAVLYNYETKRINETVRRNERRFPEAFCFQLTKLEYDSLLNQKVLNDETLHLLNMRSHFATASKKRNDRYLPCVFTEQGIAMLSGLLKSDVAIEVSIKIMQAFVEMRKFIYNNYQIFERLNSHELKFLEYDDNFNKIFNLLDDKKEISQKIFFNGQIFDAYILIVDIIKQAYEEIIIIDNYIDETILNLLSKKQDNVNVKIITSLNSKLSILDISKFNEQYPNLEVEYSNDYHDRFIIIDKDIVYHCGASLKDLGKKTFAINKIEDKKIFEKLFGQK